MTADGSLHPELREQIAEIISTVCEKCFGPGCGFAPDNVVPDDLTALTDALLAAFPVLASGLVSEPPRQLPDDAVVVRVEGAATGQGVAIFNSVEAAAEFINALVPVSEPPREAPNSDSFARLPSWQQAQATAMAEVLRRAGAYQGSQTDALTDSVALLAAARFSPEGDNHHNAALCPYCSPAVSEPPHEDVNEAFEKWDSAALRAWSNPPYSDQPSCRDAFRAGWGAALRVPDPPAAEMSWAAKEAIADEVLAARKDQYKRSFEQECPECGMTAGHACMNLGSGGGPMNHTARFPAPAGSVSLPPNKDGE